MTTEQEYKRIRKCNLKNYEIPPIKVGDKVRFYCTFWQKELIQPVLEIVNELHSYNRVLLKVNRDNWQHVPDSQFVYPSDVLEIIQQEVTNANIQL